MRQGSNKSTAPLPCMLPCLFRWDGLLLLPRGTVGGPAYSVTKRGIACHASDMCQALGVPVYAVVGSEVRLASMPCGLCCGSHGIRYIRYCGIRGPLMRLGPGLTAWAVGTAVMMPLHSSYRRRLKSEMPMTLALAPCFSSPDTARM